MEIERKVNVDNRSIFQILVRGFGYGGGSCQGRATITKAIINKNGNLYNMYIYIYNVGFNNIISLVVKQFYVRTA